MHFLLNNVQWMTFNVILGVIAIVFGWLMLKVKNPLLKFILAIWWILFLPNTIYLVTDVMHVSPGFYSVNGTLEQFILIFQYAVLVFLGVVTFIIAVYPLEEIMLHIKHTNHKATAFFITFLFNFVIAFGVVVGRVQRTNSWEVITDPIKVLKDFINVLNSLDLISLVILFGILNNFLYFTLKRPVMHFSRHLVRLLLQKYLNPPK